jgi:hypothetical protein
MLLKKGFNDWAKKEGVKTYKKMWSAFPMFMFVNHLRYVPQIAFWSALSPVSKSAQVQKKKVISGITSRPDVKRKMLYAKFPPVKTKSHG